MKLSDLLPWLDAHALQIAAVLGAVALAWKSLPAKTREAIELRFPRLAGLVRFVATVGPDVLGAVRIARYQIAGGQPRASVTPPAEGTTYAPPRAVRPDSSPGFVRFRELAALALAAASVAFVLTLQGCPLPPVDGCTPRDTRCAPDGVPEVCSQSQRWTRGQPSEPCPERSTCCRARSPYGRELHACVPPSACLPEPSAVLSTPSALAGSQ